MSDDKTPEMPQPTMVTALLAPAPAPAAKVHGSLAVKSINIVPTLFRSPGNELLDIVEIELGLPNDGNCDHMRWMDSLRFQCEHGKADGLLELMGLK
ncbi:MAG TPA: hypothetical protein VIA18_28240 [Polyangia bacterium]|jgi:hypothetical protein|nr:hypothetical protein [Polyangia bacterium]